MKGVVESGDMIDALLSGYLQGHQRIARGSLPGRRIPTNSGSSCSPARIRPMSRPEPFPSRPERRLGTKCVLWWVEERGQATGGSVGKEELLVYK